MWKHIFLSQEFFHEIQTFKNFPDFELKSNNWRKKIIGVKIEILKTIQNCSNQPPNVLAFYYEYFMELLSPFYF